LGEGVERHHEPLLSMPMHLKAPVVIVGAALFTVYVITFVEMRLDIIKELALGTYAYRCGRILITVLLVQSF